MPDGVEHEIVPDLGGPEYDSEDFATYPQRQGWNLRALIDGDLPAAYDKWDEVSKAYAPEVREAVEGWDLGLLKDLNFQTAWEGWDSMSEAQPLSPDQREALVAVSKRMLQSVIGSFLQTWLLLGILNVALRRPVLHAEIVTVREATSNFGEGTHTRVITLRKVFLDCATTFRDGLEADDKWSADLLQALKVGISFLDDLHKNSVLERYTTLPRAVELNLLVFLNTLDIHQGYHSVSKHRANWYSCASLEEEIMESRGWCPHAIYKLRLLGGAQALYYVSLLSRFGANETHDRCDELMCIASNIDNATYKTLHAEGCSGMEQPGRLLSSLSLLVFPTSAELVERSFT